VAAGQPEWSGISNREYASLAEVMGRNLWAAEVFNCQFPDTGNMETLHLFGNKPQNAEWLEPLKQGEIRSAFVMCVARGGMLLRARGGGLTCSGLPACLPDCLFRTEPGVASSDATQIKTAIKREGDTYRINGQKWWISGAGPRPSPPSLAPGLTPPDRSPGDPRCKVFLVLGDTSMNQPPGKVRRQPPTTNHPPRRRSWPATTATAWSSFRGTPRAWW
jgi:acyl-CoA dehydrogenase